MTSTAASALRSYQTDLVFRARCAVQAGKSTVVQLATGAGKTHIAVALTRDYVSRGKRVWFVCHRAEISKQTESHLTEAGISFGVVSAKTRLDSGHSVQVCSVGSLPRRLAMLPAPDLILWDECHHIAANGWAKLKDHFSNADHMGLTATPIRLDGVGLAEWFQNIEKGPSTRWLIDNGYLSDYRMFCPTGPNLREVGLKLGDYDKTKLSEVMSRPALVGDVVDHYRRLAPGTKAIAFTVSIKASKAVVARFNEAGIPAVHVDADTPANGREQAIKDLESGRINVLSNVEIFTEGVDLPAIDAVILLRPTKSYGLYRQMVGRGLRPLDGKPATILLDHAGLAYEHSVPCDDIEWTLEGLGKGAKAPRGAACRLCPECRSAHREGLVCVECGHEYEAKDRTIAEVFGELREITRGEPPEGCEVPAHFARRVGVSGDIVRRLVQKGLPTRKGYILSREAEVWFSENYKPQECKGDCPEGCERQAHFAKRTGISRSLISYFVPKGLPTRKGYVLSREAEVWVSENYKPKARKGPCPEGCERQVDFAKRMGIPHGRVGKFCLRGLPTRNGYVSSKEAEVWISENYKPLILSVDISASSCENRNKSNADSPSVGRVGIGPSL